MAEEHVIELLGDGDHHGRPATGAHRPRPGRSLTTGTSSLGDRLPEATPLGVVVDLVEKPSTSGYKERGRHRPGFKELLEHIRAGRIDCVIAYKTDRLSRGGGPGWAPLLEAFEQAGRDLDRARRHSGRLGQ